MSGKGSQNEDAFEQKFFEELSDSQSISIDKILEMEINRLANDKILQQTSRKELQMIKDQWKSFCTTYKILIKRREDQRSGQDMSKDKSSKGKAKKRPARKE